MRRIALVVALAACSNPPKPPTKLTLSADAPDPDGPHRDAIAAQVKPFLDGEIINGVVIGVFDRGKPQIYGFGKGPGGKPPNGRTLFDLGSMTKVYTGLLLAETVQRREVELEGPISDLMPPGVTVPMDQVAITPKHLALHSSGLPQMPPSLVARQPPPDPFAGYTEDAFYQDLIATKLLQPPGTTIVFSYYGTGLLGLALGRKVGGGYSAAINARVLQPLQLADTFTTLPRGASTRRAIGTDEDLKPRSRWTWGALVGAGGLISSVRDQLKIVEAELDAASGSRGPLRAAMRLTQEAQLDQPGENEGIGWMIDSAGRLFHEGTTGGFRGYIGFDPKTRRGVVVLASTESSLIDNLGRTMFDVMDGTAKPPAPAPTAEVLATYAGKYEFSGTPLTIIADGRRLYLEGPGEPRHRLVPYGARTFWTEALQAAAKFEVEGTTVKAVVFLIGNRQIRSPRVP